MTRFITASLRQQSPIGLGPLPGLLLTAAIAAVSLYVAGLAGPARWGLGALTLAILLGIFLGNTLYPTLQGRCALGVELAKQRFLRLGIILYGFRLTFQQLADVGVAALLIDSLMLVSTFLLACWLGRRLFGLDPETSMLIGAGSSICGAAAIAASEPVVKAEAEKVAVAISTVVVFGTLAMFLYPWLYHLSQHWLGAGQRAFGVYIGSTVHEVAQVVAAGQAVGSDAGAAAVIAKMIRVMMLAPFLLFLAGYLNRSRQTDVERQRFSRCVPWFAFGFIACVGFNSLALLPPTLVRLLVGLDDLLLALAMAALGLSTGLGAIRRAGVKPLLLALLLFVWLVLGGGVVNAVVGYLF